MKVKIDCSLPVKVNCYDGSKLDDGSELFEPICFARLDLITLWRGDLSESGRTRATAIIKLMWLLLEVGLIKEIQYE